MEEEHSKEPRGAASLPPWLAVREDSVAAAQRDLIECIAAEGVARAAVKELQQEVTRRTERAADPATEDAGVEAFAAWLADSRRSGAAIPARLDEAEADTARARAALTASRAALDRARVRPLCHTPEMARK